METQNSTNLLERALSKTDSSAVNTAQEQHESKVPESLRPYTFQPGKSGNPAGRPKGSRNLTTMVMSALYSKRITVKLPDGTTTVISGVDALIEKAIENAIKKGDRESIRMIWEMCDGKPTQQHRLETNGARGYEVSPEREAIILKQFDIYDGNLTPPTKAS